MNAIIDRFMHADEVLDDYRDLLLRHYISQYGKDNEELVKQRYTDIEFLFETRPDIAYDFIIKHESQYPWDDNYIEQMKKDAKILRDLQQFKENQYRAMLKEKTKEVPEDFEKVEFLVKNDYSFSKQVNYINQVIYDAISEKTNWMEQIQKRLNIKADSIVLRGILTPLLNDDFYSYVVRIGYSNGKEYKRTVLVFPWMSLYSEVCLDDAFSHELRHAIESGPGGIGIDIDSDGTYKYLNEIRTEQHAILDHDLLPPIFSVMPDEYRTYSIYRNFYPLAKDLIEPYQEWFDYYAFKNNPIQLGKIFNYDLFYEYNCNLTELLIDAQKQLLFQNKADINGKICFQQIDRMKENASRSHIHPYQKRIQ